MYYGMVCHKSFCNFYVENSVFGKKLYRVWHLRDQDLAKVGGNKRADDLSSESIWKGKTSLRFKSGLDLNVIHLSLGRFPEIFYSNTISCLQNALTFPHIFLLLLFPCYSATRILL
jgi:hypothetical protein